MGNVFEPEPARNLRTPSATAIVQKRRPQRSVWCALCEQPHELRQQCVADALAALDHLNRRREQLRHALRRAGKAA